MLQVRLGPDDILEYDARYGVIICRQCQYAIQKSALESHLLRHKIFRHKRHSLVRSIDKLNIFEPDHVPLPPPGSKRIEALPTIPGFRCTVAECNSLYASFKRMRRHQIDAHGIVEAESSASTVCSATLQTFFRGRKIKYFEVASEKGTTTRDSKHDIIEEDMPRSETPSDLHMQDAVTVPAPSSISSIESANFNLKSLVYFHHFLSTTGHTLPPPDHQKPLYWQTEFVSQSLQQDWLMAGLLALSSAHMGALAHQASAATTHHDRSTALFKEFENGRRSHAQGSFNTSSRGKPTPREGILKQLSSIIVCAHTTFFVKKATREVTLEDLIVPMRSLVMPEIALRPRNSPHSTNDVFDGAAQAMSTTVDDPELAAILATLNTLPTRMAEALDRAEDGRDVVAAVTAITNLIDNCVAGFESDEVTFWAMASWLCGAAEEFHEMLARDSPAALVVLAHWAASLVRRVEENGCWFLRGAAEFAMARIGERVSASHLGIRGLIEDLEV